MTNTGKVDRGLSEAAWNKRLDNVSKALQKLLEAKKKSASLVQDPSEIKRIKPKPKPKTKVKKRNLTPLGAYKRARKADPSGRISGQDIAYQKADLRRIHRLGVSQSLQQANRKRK